jgi:hypothetical protein
VYTVCIVLWLCYRRHGPQWDEFRSKVQQVLLHPGAARNYVEPLNQVANDFMTRYDTSEMFLKEKQEHTVT